jgi:hypothetical protein
VCIKLCGLCVGNADAVMFVRGVFVTQCVLHVFIYVCQYVSNVFSVGAQGASICVGSFWLKIKGYVLVFV